MGKNIEKIKKLVAGVGGKRTPGVGYTPTSISMRKEGEEWTDARGRSWKIEDGKRKQITKVPPRGFDKCDDCEKLILKTIDQQTYDRFKKCKYCQIDFEMKLKREDKKNGTTKWGDWVKEQEEKRWEAVLAEYNAEMESRQDSDTLKFDKKIANAVAKESHR
jgi:transcription elongation factor Elf1